MFRHSTIKGKSCFPSWLATSRIKPIWFLCYCDIEISEACECYFLYWIYAKMCEMQHYRAQNTLFSLTKLCASLSKALTQLQLLSQEYSVSTKQDFSETNISNVFGKSFETARFWEKIVLSDYKFFLGKSSLGKLEWTLESKTLDNGMPSVWLT